jgi:hypothetical protein
MEQWVCNGHGHCLCQCDPGAHVTGCNNSAFTCSHRCTPKKCPNFLVCENIVPEWLLLCKGGHCLQCDTAFGRVLTFSTEDAECPVCLETKPTVKLLNCEHMMCFSCFKRCWDGPPEPPQPAFPYPELEDEFDEYPTSHPLIFDPRVIQWHRDMDAWEKRRNTAYERERSLRQCPLCRKTMLVYG